VDTLRYLAWMMAAGLFIHGQAELTCIAVIAAVGPGHWRNSLSAPNTRYGGAARAPEAAAENRQGTLLKFMR
jgi:hypothetical protein